MPSRVSATTAKVLVAVLLAALALGAAVFVTESIGNTITPTGIVIHHSAVPPPPNGRPVDARLLDEIHRARGYGAFYWGRFYHIGYHYVILPDGTIEHGRPERCLGSHARGYNSYIGICLVGDFSSRSNPHGERGPTEPSEAQMRALVGLIDDLSKRYRIPLDRVVQHKDVTSTTECPGDRFPFGAFLNRLTLAK
jgi:hypothetical protein